MRVIAGSLGGRRFDAPRGRNTRPTSDRVREALFMSLEPLSDLRVVDLFAGSGALGIEALSRGATRVDFVESSPAARRILQANLMALGISDRSKVWPFDLPNGLNRLKGAVEAADLILLDPPYGGVEARSTLAALARMEVIRPGVRVVVEHHAKDDLPEEAGGLRRERVRCYGETFVSLYVAGAGEVPHHQEVDE